MHSFQNYVVNVYYIYATEICLHKEIYHYGSSQKTYAAPELIAGEAIDFEKSDMSFSVRVAMDVRVSCTVVSVHQKKNNAYTASTSKKEYRK